MALLSVLELVALGAPVGSELHYTEGSERLLDRLAESGWKLRLPRTFLHPGFGW